MGKYEEGFYNYYVQSNKVAHKLDLNKLKDRINRLDYGKNTEKAGAAGVKLVDDFIKSNNDTVNSTNEVLDTVDEFGRFKEFWKGYDWWKGWVTDDGVPKIIDRNNGDAELAEAVVRDAIGNSEGLDKLEPDPPVVPAAPIDLSTMKFGEPSISTSRANDLIGPTEKKPNGFKDIDIVLGGSPTLDLSNLESNVDKIIIKYNSTEFEGKLYSKGTILTFDPGDKDFDPSAATVEITPKGGGTAISFPLTGKLIKAADRQISTSTSKPPEKKIPGRTTSTPAADGTIAAAITDPALQKYFTNNKEPLASLGLDEEYLKTVDSAAKKANLTDGLNKLKDLDEYLKTKQNVTDPKLRTPDVLLGGSYRLTALAAITEILGGTSTLKNPSTDKEKAIKAAIIKALDTTTTGGGTKGAEFLEAFIATGWGDNPKNIKALNYVATPSKGGPGALGTYDQKQVLEQAQNITSDTAATQAKGWLAMYGKGGIGGRDYKVLQAGQVTDSGNASIHHNMPAFATRFLLSGLPEKFSELSTRVKELIPAIDLDNLTTIAEFPGMDKLKGKIDKLSSLPTDEFKNFISGLFATSIVSISEGQESSKRKVIVKIDVLNLAKRILGVDSVPAPLLTLLGIKESDTTKDITLTLNETAWEGNIPATKKESGVFNVLDQLFNTNNNPNNKANASTDPTMFTA